MKKQLMTQVTDSIFEVMETMFYRTLDEMPDIDPDNPPGDPDRFQTAAVSFSGEFSGTIFMRIPNTTAPKKARAKRALSPGLLYLETA